MNQHAPGTRDRLVSAARRLFADHGFHRASVRAITTHAKANLGAVTYHFGSKDRLRNAVLDQLFGSMADRLAAAAAGPGLARQRLARIVHGIFEFFAANPDAPRLLVHLLAAGPSFPAATVTHQRRILQLITGVVQEGAAAGELRAVEPLMAAVERHITEVITRALAPA